LEEDKLGKILSVRIVIDKFGNPGSCTYKNKINFEDFKQLALFFHDLKMEGADVEKAFNEFKEKEKEVWPF
jgi:predicted SpoU family rRNA methylase